jgi:hypothetical protein
MAGHVSAAPRSARAVAAALAIIATACHFPGSREPGPPLVVRNAARSGVNVYLSPKSGAAEVFLGQVGPGKSHTFHIRGTSPGDTVSLRARPITGQEQYARDRIVLDPGATWQIP